MDQPVQLPNGFRFPTYTKKMHFIHRPGEGWQLTTQLDPEVAIVGLDQLTPPVRNDYLTLHRMMQNKENVRVKTVKEQVVEIRNIHIRLIESIRDDSWLPRNRRRKVPRLDELDGAKINVCKYLHWTPIQISWYEDLCRREYLAVLGIVHKARIGALERDRYMDALARVFPKEWSRRQDDGNSKEERKGQDNDEQQRKEPCFDPKQIFEDSEEYFFPGNASGGMSLKMSEAGETETANPSDPTSTTISQEQWTRSSTIPSLSVNTLNPSIRSSRLSEPEELCKSENQNLHKLLLLVNTEDYCKGRHVNRFALTRAVKSWHDQTRGGLKKLERLFVNRN